MNKQLAGLQQTSANKQQALKQAEEDYRSLEEKLKAVDASALDKQIEKLRQEREQLLIEQARLEASGNIKDLRGRLQDGQPCPVCGSTHHPFVNQAPVAPVSTLTLQLQDLSKKKRPTSPILVISLVCNSSCSNSIKSLQTVKPLVRI